jgi:hypothetical protein
MISTLSQTDLCALFQTSNIGDFHEFTVIAHITGIFRTWEASSIIPFTKIQSVRSSRISLMLHSISCRSSLPVFIVSQRNRFCSLSFQFFSMALAEQPTHTSHPQIPSAIEVKSSRFIDEDDDERKMMEKWISKGLLVFSCG